MQAPVVNGDLLAYWSWLRIHLGLNLLEPSRSKQVPKKIALLPESEAGRSKLFIQDLGRQGVQQTAKVFTVKRQNLQSKSEHQQL